MPSLIKIIGLAGNVILDWAVIGPGGRSLLQETRSYVE
jgi:hypothetical protein